MISKQLSFELPKPWHQKRFETPQIGVINFLGSNGSDKSKFAEALHSHLGNARMLGTDRLSGMEHSNALRSIYGDHFAGGLRKDHFSQLKGAGQQVQELNRGPGKEFSVVVTIAEMLGQTQRLVRVNHLTNAGMGDFTLEFA